MLTWINKINICLFHRWQMSGGPDTPLSYDYKNYIIKLKRNHDHRCWSDQYFPLLERPQMAFRWDVLIWSLRCDGHEPGGHWRQRARKVLEMWKSRANSQSGTTSHRETREEDLRRVAGRAGRNGRNRSQVLTPWHVSNEVPSTGTMCCAWELPARGLPSPPTVLETLN